LRIVVNESARGEVCLALSDPPRKDKMDRPPPEADESSAFLTLCTYVGSTLIEVSATHVVELVISTTGLPPYVILPALIVTGIGIHYAIRRWRQRHLKR
jgi:hypothetical protein